MFWLISKKLEGQELVDAVKKLQDASTPRKEKNDAFKELRETFGGLIGNKIKSVMHVAENSSERNEIKHHVETSFLQVLTELTPKSAPEIVAYVNHAFKTKINQESIKNLLGKGEILSDIGKYKYRFKNALRDFHKKYKRMPDFNKVDLSDAEDESDDVEKFSKILKVDENQVLEILKLFGQGTIKSMYEEVAGDDEGEGALALMETLKSDVPMPDEVLENKKLREEIDKAIKQEFPDANEQKVIRTYLFPTDADFQQAIKQFGKDNVGNQLTNDQVAAITGISERKVRHWLSKHYRDKLEKSPILKQLYTEAMIKSFVKIAMARYGNTEDLIFEVVSSQCKQ